MSSLLGVYYAPMHDRPQDWDYMRRLQPPVVRILLSGADAQRVVQVHQAAPQARISLRWWDIDDGGEGNKRSKLNNPQASGAGDAVEVLRRVEQMEMVARGNGWVFPPREKIIANSLNEPPIWEAGVREQTVAYCIAFLAGLHPHRIPVALGCINTGHPSEWPPVWDWFQPVADVMIVSPLNMLELHSYWQLEGPNHEWTDEHGNQRKDWGALAGRYMHCPFDVPILIGECGADGRLYGRKADHTGWQGNISATQYAQQLRWYHEQIQKDERIVAMLPFLTDYQNREWASFDTMPAREEILSIAVHVPEPQPIEPPPPVISPGPTEPPEPQPGNLFERSLQFVLKEEGGFQADPNDKGNYYNGVLIGTKYGISAASWGGQYDIPNLTLEQAKHIYRTAYWQPSGADKLAWPLCLLVFDSSVLHGVGAARAWVQEMGTNPYKVAARRLRVYTSSDNWQHFGRGWTARTARLLEAMAS